MEKLKAGDKYLSIKLSGHNAVAAFKNLNKRKPTEPDYKGDGVAVWISTKKDSSVKVNTDDLS
jgi:hypothetical protein